MLDQDASVSARSIATDGAVARPRILFLDQSGELAGAELTLLDVARDWLGHCRVLLFGDGVFRSALTEIGVEVDVMPLPARLRGFRRESGFGQALSALPRIVGWISRLRRAMAGFDLVVANTQKSFVLGCVAAKLAGRPIVWVLQDIISEEHFSRFNRRLTVTLANRLASRVITISQASARSFIAAGGNARKIATVPIGIDATEFAMKKPQLRRRLRAQLGIGDEFLVGLFSRISPWKGQHVLIEAMSQTKDMHALIVGKELFGESDYARAIREQARDLGVEHRVHFFGFTREVGDLLAACDAVVHTSVSAEPFGRVLLEGMLAGRPVIAAAAGAPLELIEDGKSGFLVRTGDGHALAVMLERLALDPDLCRKVGLEAQQRAEANFSLAAMLRGMRAEFTAAVRPPRRFARS